MCRVPSDVASLQNIAIVCMVTFNVIPRPKQYVSGGNTRHN